MFFENSIADAAARGIIIAVLALGWMNLLIRLNGLRSLSKMTNFDFVTTVAFGSLLAGAAQVSEWTAALQSFAAMLGLVLAQAATSFLRRRSDAVAGAVGNEPCLIMRNGEFDEEALKATNVRREDMIAKLREANVLQMSQVRAVILETTGDVSVLHGSEEIDEIILTDVRGAS